jgi:squalene-associated FAD-dependent desaturase
MCAASTARKVAVIGAGWAGCSAAVELASAGCQVTLFEAARVPGGRARAVQAHGKLLDNGQHILLGAYSETLRLLRQVGVDPAAAMLNLPLQMRYPALCDGMDFVAPRLPAPLHLMLALVRATGLGRADKLALMRFSSVLRWMDWRINDDCSVAELLVRFDQSERLCALMWRPLCLAALNTPPERASAQVFLHVLRDSLGAARANSDMLLPRLDLSTLFPRAAARYIEERGGALRLGAKVGALSRSGDLWQLEASGSAVGGNWSMLVDAVVVAGSAPATAALLEPLGAHALAQQLMAFEYEPITTVYLQYPAGTALALPLYALRDDPASGHWGQFVFDRGQLDPGQAGLFSIVVSAATAAMTLSHEALAQAIAAQLAAVLGRPELAHPGQLQVITEKRATFACTPGLLRPAVDAAGLPALAIAGDYTASDYPATLESATRSGVAAARAVLA